MTLDHDFIQPYVWLFLLIHILRKTKLHPVANQNLINADFVSKYKDRLYSYLNVVSLRILTATIQRSAFVSQSPKLSVQSITY